MTEVENKSPAPPVSDHAPAPEQANDGNNPEPDTSQFPPQGPSGQPFPPPNFGFYNYPPGQAPPPGEGGNQDAHAQPQPNGNGQGPPTPYPPPPPGMIFPYPYPQPPPGRSPAIPPSQMSQWIAQGYMPVSMSGMPLPGALVKPKRKQVKMACTNCAAACKRCDVSRPCERCIKYGLSDSCRDGQRKERKKGFKRGPYNKRKRQEEREAHEWEAAQNNPNGEWTPGGPSGAPFPGPPQQGGFPPPPEGYYPAFYTLAPPPPGPGPQLVPVAQSGAPNEHPVEGQADGNADPTAHGQGGDQGQAPQGQPGFPPPHAQFVYPPMPPGSYPPFGYPFQHPAQQQPPQPQHQQPQQPQQPPQQPPQPPPQQPDATVSAPAAPAPAPAPATAKRPAPEDTKEEDEDDPPTPPRKRRGRRNSDGEWPGGSKRVTKAKGEDPAPTRRSTRRQQHQAERTSGAGAAQAVRVAPNDGGIQVPDENALQQHIDNPVLADNPAAI